MRYPAIIGMGECAYYGVRRDDAPGYTCNQILDPHQRMFIEESLSVAQERIEHELSFPLMMRAVVGEHQSWNARGLAGPLRWRYVQAVGSMASETIQAGAALNLGVAPTFNDPVVLIVATTVTNPCEVKVYHTSANGGGLMDPSDITISGGNVTITIPRCRLVDPTLTQPDTGFAYDVNTNFVDEVDVVREYVEPGTGALIVWDANNVACLPTCQEYTQTACPSIVDPRLSVVKLFPAVYSDGTWTAACLAKAYYPDRFRLDYVAYYNDPTVDPYLGCSEIPLTLERAIIRLAHCEMPRIPCTCQWHQIMWQEDNTIPDNYLPGMDNPFGPKLGQMAAWKAVAPFIIGEGGVL